jgi:hypothetical protein
MKTLTGADLLQVWERGQGQNAVKRALLLLATAFPEIDTQALAELSIGRRESYLVSLREKLFGTQFISVANCPRCDEKLELTFSSADIRATPDPALPSERLLLKSGDYEVEFRLPNSLDLLNLEFGRDISANRQALLERCLLNVMFQGELSQERWLPPEVVEGISLQMSLADPQADVQLALVCTACSYDWLANFDILAFLWDEITAFAHRLLQEVHLLATAYGWREADILALSPWRRQYYLDRIAGF